MCDTAYQQIFPYLPQSLRNLLEALPPEQLRGLEEIRLKPGLPVLLRFDESEALLTSAGNLTSDQTAEGLRLLSPDEMRRTVLLLADSSLYAFEEELRRGYITLNGGHRAGLTGRAVLAQGAIRTIKEISGINIRIARHIAGVALPLLPCLVDAQARLLPTLIISPPRAGKTTMLRDLARLLSDGVGIPPLRVGLVDERSELAAMRNGIAQLPVGLRTDVMDGCPKAEGMLLLLRSMSPDVLITDEIGRSEDAAALREAAHAGVAVIASAHGCDEAEIRLRPVLAGLLAENAFRRIVILSRRHGPGTIERVYAPGGEGDIA